LQRCSACDAIKALQSKSETHQKMTAVLWWNQHRRKAALPVACFTGVLVWFAAARRGNLPSNRAGTPLQHIANAHETSAELQKNPEQEVLQSQAPREIAETLRTDPRGTQPEDRAPVWSFLQKPEGLVFGKEGEWLLGADEALNWLRGAEQAAAEVEDGLVGLALEQKLPSALREHALQHLGLWAEEHPAGPRVADALKTVSMAEASSPLSGIALAALFRSGFASQEKAWIQKQGLHLATSKEAHPLSRSLALQILGQSKAAEAEPIARSLFKGAATVQEKIGALQVLRWVGTAETLAWLGVVSEETEPLTAAAQRQTLQILKERWTRRE